jgi:hypothetical protein
VKTGSAYRILIVLALLSFLAAACEDPDNFIDGSITSQYEMGFDSVAITQFLQSNSLHVEYVREQGTGEEKPLMVTISPTPPGPGLYIDGADGYSINITNRLATANALPAIQSAEVELDSFTPREVDSDVAGRVGALLNRAGSGDAFSLEAGYKSSLRVQP